MLSLITVNYNSHQVIDALLKSIQHSRLSGCEMEVIVWDNYVSTEEQRALQQVCHRYPFARLVLSEENLGFAAGNNGAVRHSTGEYLFFINPDCLVTDDVYDGYQQAIASGYDVAMFPMVDEHGQGVKFLFKYPFMSYFLRKSPARWGTGANLLMTRRIFSEIGGWPEDYFMYSEDTDMHYRLKNQNIPVHVLDGVRLKHIGNVCAGAVWSSVGRERVLYRSMLKFAKKYNRKLDFLFYYWMVTMVLAIKNPQLFKLRIRMLFRGG